MLFRRSFQFLWSLVFIVPLLAFAYIGHFSRYIADDYCTTSVALAKGIPGSVVHWYTTWAGQYTNWTLKGIAAYLGTGFPGVLPALILTLWLGASIWTVRQITLALGLTFERWLLWGLGAMAVFAVFAGIPSITQSLYWLGASIPYTLPLGSLIFLIGFVIHSVRSAGLRLPVGKLILAFLITLIAGGTSEVFAAFQIAVIGLMLVGSYWVVPVPRKRAAMWLTGIGLLGAVTALVLIMIAPGNAFRQAAFSQHLTLPEIAVQTVIASVSYVFLAIGIFSPMPLLICVVFPAVTLSHLAPHNSSFRLRPKEARRLLALSFAIALILLMACFAPSIYAVASTPPARVYIFPQLIMVSLALCWGFIIGLSTRQRTTYPNHLITALIMILMLVGPLFSTAQTLSNASAFSTYAAEWDARDQAIRVAAAGGEQSVEANTLTVDIGGKAALDTINEDANNWVNLCAAQYYGVKSIVTQSLLPMADKSSR